jgi:4-aminobutyrate aminotransferase
MKNKRRTQLLSPVWSRSSDFFVDHGQGVYLYTVDGQRYMDFTSGIGVTNTGHAHPRVVEAIQNQAAKLIHGQANIVYHEPMIRLSEELSHIVPRGVNSFFFSNSGAEAVEAAGNLARAATGKQNIIVFQGSFHGRTHATMAMTTSMTIYRAGFHQFAIRELKKLLKMQTAPFETAAIVIEPVLGEGGYVPAPNSFMQAVRQVCSESGILMVVDEVQSGFGRTGKWFAFEHSGIVPDIIIMAKGMASGMPLSGIAANKRLMDKWTPGSHGGTYGGNVVACAAAVATIQVMHDELLIANSARMGDMLMAGLGRLQEEHPEIGDVRGLGLMVASEFTTPDGQPWGERAQAVAKAAYGQNLMLLTAGAYGNVIRWIPPLVVDEEQIQEALAIFAAGLNETG